MTLLTRDQILGVSTFRFMDVDLPELGGAVRVRDIGCLAVDKLRQYVTERQTAGDFIGHIGEYKLLLCSLAICDDKGDRLFSQDDIAVLNDRFGSTTLDPVFEAAKTVNGMTDKSAGDVAKNSESPSSDSGSDSPATSGAPSLS